MKYLWWQRMVSVLGVTFSDVVERFTVLDG